MASNSAKNIGTRKMVQVPTGFEYRNFETDGTAQYKAVRDKLSFIGSTVYNSGDVFPFDQATTYGPVTLQILQLYWEQDWIVPVI
jgi:hypothetical protein